MRVLVFLKRPSSQLTYSTKMAHVCSRSNERESNPNPAVDFISVLDPEDDSARQLMRALAGQLESAMKVHGFNVNSF
jgi:hypothetical protein